MKKKNKTKTGCFVSTFTGVGNEQNTTKWLDFYLIFCKQIPKKKEYRL